jgi:hypothetical protein
LLCRSVKLVSLTLWQNIWTSERGIDNTGEKYKNRSFVMCALHVICADEEIKEDGNRWGIQNAWGKIETRTSGKN